MTWITRVRNVRIVANDLETFIRMIEGELNV